MKNFICQYYYSAIQNFTC